MKKILFLTLLCTTFSLLGQDTATRKVLILASEMGLKGGVKTYKVTPYKVVEYFGDIKKGEKQDFWNGDVIISFDEKGYKTETSRFNKTGQLFQKIIYKYDGSGRRLTRDVYNAFGKLLMKNTYVYDGRGNKEAYKSFTSEGKVSETAAYKNDSRGRAIEEFTTKNDGAFVSKYTYKYDATGAVSEICQYTKDENTLDSCIRYKHDKIGLLLEVENYNRSGKLTKKTTYKYDDKGNETEICTFDGNGRQTEIKEYTYTFDDRGNWVERIEFVNYFARVFIEREITYY